MAALTASQKQALAAALAGNPAARESTANGMASGHEFLIVLLDVFGEGTREDVIEEAYRWVFENSPAP